MDGKNEVGGGVAVVDRSAGPGMPEPVQRTSAEHIAAGQRTVDAKKTLPDDQKTPPRTEDEAAKQKAIGDAVKAVQSGGVSSSENPFGPQMSTVVSGEGRAPDPSLVTPGEHGAETRATATAAVGAALNEQLQVHRAASVPPAPPVDQEMADARRPGVDAATAQALSRDASPPPMSQVSKPSLIRRAWNALRGK